MRSAPILALLLLSACADKSPPPVVTSTAAPLGERIAQRECGQCHSVDGRQASPLADAPKFPALRSRYSRDGMAVVLEKRIQDVHPRMPEPHFDIDEIDYFLDYWESLPAQP